MNGKEEHKHRLELPLLLPDVEGTKDQCVERLTERLLGNQGVSRAHIDETGPQAMLCMHYDPDVIPLQRLERIAKSAGAKITRRYRHEIIHLLGMGGVDSAANIEHMIGRTDGVVHVSVNYAAERMRVEYDTERTSTERIVSRIRGMGYGVAAKRREGWVRGHWELLLSLASGLFLAVGFFGSLSAFLPRNAAVLLYLLAYIAGGFNATRHGIRAALHLEFDIDVLMVVAAIGAAAIGQWADGAVLLFLFSLGHALEHSALGVARKAIDQLTELLPQRALVRREGKEELVAITEVLRGDLVVVRSGDRVPVDGIVLSGESEIDESGITGESMPKTKVPAEQVYAGTINGEGSLVIEVTKLSRDTMLSRIIALVEDAQTQKAPTERVIDRFERVFVPTVLVGVVLIAILPVVAGILSFDAAFLRAMTILVATSPCALAIATPAAVLSAIARAARGGVLVKGGAHLETLGHLRAVAFDKTGTITVGKPTLSRVILGQAEDERHLLAAAAAVEQHSNHPLARAIVAEAEERGIELALADAVRTSTGKGIVASLGEREVTVGSVSFVAEHGTHLDQSLAEAVHARQRAGETVILVAEGGELLGALAFADAPRPNARESVRNLRKLGIAHAALITGDNPSVADTVGSEVGIEDRRSGLLPDEKVQAVKELIARYGPTAMVGDGVNDAPALARASVGIAMGAHGSDVALETADVALLSDDLSMLPFAIGLSRRARRIIIENLVVALGVIVVLLGSAITGIVSIGLAIVIHEGSTLVVVTNALRLLGYRQRER